MLHLHLPLKRAYLEHAAAFRVLLGGHSHLTPSRFQLLHALYEGPDHMRNQTELHGLMDVAPSVVSRMLHALEILGFVDRTRCPDDLRRARVHLTESGTRVVHDILERTREQPYDVTSAALRSFPRKSAYTAAAPSPPVNHA